MTELVIEPGRIEKQYWKDLWRYRELFYFLAWRDMLVRYKQTVIGVAWAVLRPLLTMIVFTVVFGRVAKLPSRRCSLRAAGLSPPCCRGSFSPPRSPIEQQPGRQRQPDFQGLFPALIVPAGSVITSFVDFLISFAILGVLMVWYRFWPDWRILCLPLFMALASAAAFGAGLWLVRAERRIPRLPLHGPVHRAVRPVHLARGLQQHCACRERHGVLLYSPEPDGGCHRRFPLVAAGGEAPLYWPGLLAFRVVVIGFSAVSGIWYFRKMERTLPT